MRSHGDYLRWLYRGRRPHWFARFQNRLWAIASSAGIWPRRLATLEVRGRRSGRLISFPVVLAEVDGDRYLVSMLGERANWPGNVRSAGGRAVLRHGRREEIRLVEVEPAGRAPIIRAYLAVAPGARPHLEVDRHADLHDFERIADDVPVFRVTPWDGASAPSSDSA